MKFHGVGLRFRVVAIFLVAILCVTNANPDDQQCPALTPDMLRCLKQWACQHFICEDLHCPLSGDSGEDIGQAGLVGGLLGGVLGGSGSLLGDIGGMVGDVGGTVGGMGDLLGGAGDLLEGAGDLLEGVGGIVNGVLG